MGKRTGIAVMAAMALIIVGLVWLLFATPPKAPAAPISAQATSSVPAALPKDSASSTQPLDASVIVKMPSPNATVSHSFEVVGTAPGAWFFESVFPIQVRDANDDLVGTSQGRAQGDPTKSGPIDFTSSITVDGSYEGPADLILLKDNPSGDPENADEVTVPITIR